MSTRDLSFLQRIRHRAAELRRAVLRRRRPLAVLCVAGAVLAALRVAAPPEPATVGVLVADRDLPAGTVLDETDLRRTDLPAGAVPDALVESPAGSVLAAPLRRGEPVTDVRLVGPALTADDPGAVALPVRISDAAQAGLLTVGDRIDLLATDPQARTTSTVASDATVLALPPEPEQAGGALAGRVVVLGVSAGEVEEVTSSAVVAFVTYRWVTR